MLVACACALAWWRPGFAAGWWKRVEARAGSLPAGAALAIVFLAPLLLRAGLLPVLGIPRPVVMDEFSYLLGADTFALGRMANPAVPVPEAFHVLYVLLSPSYVSVYPPAQAAVLAVGQVFFGHPWWGIFLSAGAMAATAFWMARAFVPDRWALFGGLVVGLQLGVFTYWMNSYWGGTVAAIGGNLAAGAYGRLRTRPAAWPAVIFLVGAAVLGLRRPYEGLVLVATLSALLAHDLKRRRSLSRVWAPAFTGLLLFAAFTGWYNWRTTGDWNRSPYQAGTRTASAAPIFVFQDLRPAPQLPANLQRVETEYRIAAYREMQSPGGYAAAKFRHFLSAASFFLRPALLAPMLFAMAGLWVLRLWKLGVGLLAGVAALLPEVPFHTHYLTPFVPLYCLLVVLGFRCLRQFSPRGMALSRWLAAIAGAMFLVTYGLALGGVARGERFGVECCGSHPRDGAERYLMARGMKSLVLVRYGPYENPHHEFVYNRADIKRAKIVWARDLGPAATQRLLDEFPEREVWRLDVGMLPDGKLRLYRYSTGQNSAVSISAFSSR